MPLFPLDVRALPEEVMVQKKGIICTGEVEGGKTGGNWREFEEKSGMVWRGIPGRPPHSDRFSIASIIDSNAS
ncbi:hypothetical protein Metli_2010 [Methanofollis liminatans DSM 4140]|uniref:Uncharacterized protein n=1 Tax=Methanofollis liminatans DSM 4140 TaxID=28892 RepID=J1L4C9_9EURY|nr:hypothetical protein Metli_2010 [Methanofollis liminatans DSM 4140]